MLVRPEDFSKMCIVCKSVAEPQILVEWLIARLSLQMLNALPDQDTFYDVTDALEEQGIEAIVQRHMNRKGSDLDLLEQFQIYETVLKHEDGDETGPIVGSSMGDIRYLTFNVTLSNLDRGK